VTVPVVTWEQYAADWATLHGGTDLRRARPWVRRWLRLAFVIARSLRSARVRPGAVTAVGLIACALTPVFASFGGRFCILAAALVAFAAVADTVDGALAVLSGHTTRLGYVYDAVVDRIGEACWLIALWQVGAAGGVVVAAGALAWLHEYARSRANAAGMTEITAVTVGERPTRALLAFGGLLLAGFTGAINPRVPAGIAAFATATWVVLGLIGFGQLFAAVHKSLAGKYWPRSRPSGRPAAAPTTAPTAAPAVVPAENPPPLHARAGTVPISDARVNAGTAAAPPDRMLPMDAALVSDEAGYVQPVGVERPVKRPSRPAADRGDAVRRRDAARWFDVRRLGRHRAGEEENASADADRPGGAHPFDASRSSRSDARRHTGAGAGAHSDHETDGDDVDDSMWANPESRDRSGPGDLTVREPTLDDLLGDAGARVRGAVDPVRYGAGVYTSRHVSGGVIRPAENGSYEYTDAAPPTMDPHAGVAHPTDDEPGGEHTADGDGHHTADGDGHSAADGDGRGTDERTEDGNKHADRGTADEDAAGHDQDAG
jgi:CDP-diacylglycerol--glycerol-3-phosphate 3-phosphatidyltransferase